MTTIGATIKITSTTTSATRELSVGKSIIGREIGDIVLGDPQCSSRHGELDWDGQRLLFRDLGSTNGTFFNGQRIAEKVLVPGETLTIGAARIEFVGSAAAGRTVVAQPAVDIGPKGTMVAPLQAGVAVVKAVPAMPVKAPQAQKKTSAASLVVGCGGALLLFMLVFVALAVYRRGGAGGTMSEGEANVTAVAFIGGPSPRGTTSPVTVRIKKNDSGNVSVGTMEEFVDGAGTQWKTATWQAAFAASRAAGISLVDHEYLVRSKGHIDGPSAGMLLTSTMWALLDGYTLRKDSTMTGTINPDGTAGPVGGIVQKMQGAKEAGFTRFGYPVGLRNHQDLATKQMVDLEEYGRSLGLEVKEIATLDDAFTFMTGIARSAPAAVDENTMRLDNDTRQRLRAKMLAWRGRVDKEATSINDELKKKKTVAVFQDTLASGNKNIEAARRFEQSDLPVAALEQYRLALMMFAGVRGIADLADKYRARDFSGVVAQIEASRTVQARTAAFEQELRVAAKKQTVGGAVNLTRAMVTYSQARALANFGDDQYDLALQNAKAISSGRVKDTPQNSMILVQQLAAPIAVAVVVEILLDAARDELDLVADEGQARPVDASAFAREAAGYGSAAGATIAYFDATVIEPEAKAAGKSMEQLQAVFAQIEFSYRVARAQVRFAEGMTVNADDPSSGLLKLAAGSNAFLLSASLVNKYYSLGAERQEDGSVIIGNRKALATQLDLAKQNARVAAARAQKQAGFIPIAARVAYEAAGAAREGDDDSKVQALFNYWESAHWSELSARLAL